MCTLHLFYQVFPGSPVVFAANRDETLDRPWDPPQLLSRTPRIFGPRDLTAGGTWLGVNEAGVLVSLANHRGTLRRGSASLCSRGTVVLESLRRDSARAVRQFAEWVSPVCKAYTLLIADAVHAYVIDHGPHGTQSFRLLPGCHVITNDRFRDPDDAKAARQRRRMTALTAHADAPTAAALFQFLADHTAAAADAFPLCVHPDGASRFGTSSASTVRIDRTGQITDFSTAPGPPCTTAPVDHTAAAHRGLASR